MKKSGVKQLHVVLAMLRKTEYSKRAFMNMFVCPHCSKEIEVSQAIRHQIEEGLRSELSKKHQEDIEKLKEDLEKKVKERAKEELSFQMKNQENELVEARKRNKELQDQLLELNTLMRSMKEQHEKMALENQKKLNEEMEKMRESIAKTEQEKASIEKLQLQKKISDMEKALIEAQRKGQQSSQQLQGEVMELSLEEQLRTAFTTDDVLPVAKGIEGADVIQRIKNKFGQEAGTILWEVKRTKAWSNGWLAKLRENTRQVGASIAILVSDVVPEGIASFGLVENVWVTKFEYAIALASVLRRGLLELAIAKKRAASNDERIEALYQYLTTDTFRHRFEAQVESIIELKHDLEAEQRTMVRVWKKREVQINRMRNNVASLYGELQGIVGPSLPTIHSLEASGVLSEEEQLALQEE